MKFIVLFLFLINSLNVFSKNTEAFIIEISDTKMKVTSPLKKLRNVSIIIKNKTLDKIVSELRTVDKVLKRFVLHPQGREVIQVDYSKIKNLAYIPVSPPFSAAQLTFGQRPYEIPKKK